MRILFTGASGVVGIRAVPLLVAAGHDVTAVARHPGRSALLGHAGAKVLALDLFDRSAVERAAAGHDVVINMATRIPVGFRTFLPWSWRENDRLRSVASRILADAAIAGGVGRFIQESFAPAYPDRRDAWIDERTPLHTVRYNRSVEDAELAAQRASDAGRAGVVLRFGLFYGPNDPFVKTAIGALRKRWSPLPGEPGAFVSMVSHDDAARAVVAALELPAGTYNVVDNDPPRRGDFMRALAAAIGAPEPRFLPPWTARLMGVVGSTIARSVRISNDKLRAASAWSPQFATTIDGWRALL